MPRKSFVRHSKTRSVLDRGLGASGRRCRGRVSSVEGRGSRGECRGLRVEGWHFVPSTLDTRPSTLGCRMAYEPGSARRRGIRQAPARIFHSLGAVLGCRSCVAQVSNLLYRRLPVGRLCLLGSICGLEIRDTAGWKPALRLPVGKTSETSGLRSIAWERPGFSPGTGAEQTGPGSGARDGSCAGRGSGPRCGGCPWI